MYTPQQPREHYLLPGEQTHTTAAFLKETDRLRARITEPEHLADIVLQLHDLPYHREGEFLYRIHRHAYNELKNGKVDEAGVEIQSDMFFHRTAEQIAVEGPMPDVCSDYALLLRTYLVGGGIPSFLLEAVRPYKGEGFESHTFVGVYLADNLVTVNAHPHQDYGKNSAEIIPEKIIANEELREYLVTGGVKEGRDFADMNIRTFADWRAWASTVLGKDIPDWRIPKRKG